MIRYFRRNNGSSTHYHKYQNGIWYDLKITPRKTPGTNDEYQNFFKWYKRSSLKPLGFLLDQKLIDKYQIDKSRLPNSYEYLN
jgi:hypothetical protein